jgi:hypothetical protein
LWKSHAAVKFHWGERCRTERRRTTQWRIHICECIKSDEKVLSYLRRLLAGFSPRGPGFEPGPRNVASVVDRAALGHVFSEYAGSLYHSLIPLIAPQTSPSVIQGCYNRRRSSSDNSGLGSTPAPNTTP